mgnify:CR=1 FL=1
MKRIKTHILRRCFAFLMAAIVLAGTAITSPMTAHAADGTLNFQTGELISYGDYYTTKMSVDNNGTAYCVQPMKKHRRRQLSVRPAGKRLCASQGALLPARRLRL